METAPEPAVLPDDVLAEVLRRLPPHSLVTCQAVCKAWRDIVGTHRLLRLALLPRSLRGIFINYAGLSYSEFFSRPSTGPGIRGGLDFLPSKVGQVEDHCNGLLLCNNDREISNDRQHDYVVNPATRRWARLPERPLGLPRKSRQAAYLVFDPASSPHYEVFLIPGVPPRARSEWPPASYMLYVFSSVTRRWEKKQFRREGEAAGTAACMASRPWRKTNRAVYWQGALHVHCQGDFFTRMSLSNYKYRVIKLPHHQLSGSHRRYHLGRSSRGVYCAVTYNFHGLQVWYLSESGDQIEWVLKHVFLQTFAHKFHGRADYHLQMKKYWILQDVNYSKAHHDNNFGLYCKVENYKAPVEEKYEWDSDDDNVLDMEDAAKVNYTGHIGFLGFHPYKEMVFLNLWLKRGVAYDWNSSKFQDLGNLYPTNYYDIVVLRRVGIDAFFPYTPCWMDESPGNNLESQHEDEQNNLESQHED